MADLSSSEDSTWSVLLLNDITLSPMARRSRTTTVRCRGIEIGDPVDAGKLGVKQFHKLFSESFQAQEQVGRFRQKNK